MGFSPISYTGNWRRFFPPAILTLIISCTVVLFLEELLEIFGGPEARRWYLQWFGLVPYAVIHPIFRFWQPFTYLFLHDGILHLALNMLFLWMFGADLERSWGSRKFYNYYFLCGVGAGLITILVKVLVDHANPAGQLVPTIGASGAIYGVLLAAGLLFPDRQVWLFPLPVAIPLRIFAIAAVVIEFLSSLSPGGDNVAHVCHLGGMLVGYLYLRRGSFLYGVRNRYSDWHRKRLRRKFEIYSNRHRDEPPPSRPDNWLN